MIAAWWYRLVRIFGSWEQAGAPRPRAKRMARDWWRNPPAFDKGWRKGIVARQF
jgi:hypothetical protein